MYSDYGIDINSLSFFLISAVCLFQGSACFLRAILNKCPIDIHLDGSFLLCSENPSRGRVRVLGPVDEIERSGTCHLILDSFWGSHRQRHLQSCHQNSGQKEPQPSLGRGRI